MSELTPSLDIIEDQVTYKQEFDVRTYPYEYHNLKIEITSMYSSKIVQLEMLPVDAGMLQPTVPQGWTLRSVDCNVITSQAGRAISQLSEGDIAFSTYTCEIMVSRTNTGWWMTSFLLFIGLNFISFVGGLGFTCHIVAEARDDKDAARAGLFTGLRMNGVFSIGLLLTYVFQVQLSPYDQSIEFWPSIPASTMIYVLGLVGILTASLLSMVMGLLAKKALVVDGFSGGIMWAYNLKKVPKEGEAPEEDFPLRDLKKEKEMSNNKTQIQEQHPSSLVSEEAETVVHSNARQVQEQHPSSVPEDVEVPVSPEEATVSAEGKVPVARRCNAKKYPVLSIQEAVIVNGLVRLDLFARTFIIVSVAVTGSIIMLQASVIYSNAIG